MKKQVRSLVRKELKKDVEVKYVELHMNEQPLNVLGASTVYNLSQIGEGTGPYQRIGKKVRNIGIHIKGIINNNTNVTQFARFVVVQSKDDNPITAASLLQASTAAGATGGAAVDPSGGYVSGVPLSGLDTIYYKMADSKVSVLAQWTIKLGQSLVLDGSNAVMFNRFIKSKRTLEFKNSGDAQCSRPVYLIVWVADAPDDATTGTVELNSLCTTYYTDM